MEINKDALKELLNTQIESVEGFDMGDELMKNAVNDIETLSRAAATLSKTENDDEKHELEMELLRKKDEREERECNTRIKQGWIGVVGSFLGGLVSFGLYYLMNIDRAIDEHNGDIKSRNQMNLFKAAGDSMMRTFRGKKG